MNKNKCNIVLIIAGIILTKLAQILRYNDTYVSFVNEPVLYNSMPNFLIALVLPNIWYLFKMEGRLFIGQIIKDKTIRICLQSFLVLNMHEVIRLIFLNQSYDIWDILASSLGLSIHFVIYKKILNNE